MKQYIVTGMSCAACQARVEKAVSKVSGVDSCSVSLLTNSMGVEGKASPKDIIKAVEDAGYGASVKGEKDVDNLESTFKAEEEALKDRETPILVKRLVYSAVFLLAIMYISMGHGMLGWPIFKWMDNYVSIAVTQMLLAIIVMFINRKFFTSGFKSMIMGAPNMDTLVALGSATAFGYSLVELYVMMNAMAAGDSHTVMKYGMNLYFETAAMIPTLITVGKTLESLSKGRTTDALKSLMQLEAKTAVVIKDDVETEVSIEQVQVGDIFIVKPGANVPVDGIVIEGESAVNESALTGESIPVDKMVGDTISAATLNQSGYIKAKATRVGKDTTLSQIIQMVSDAAATKAPIARIADKVSGVFVPAVIIIASVTFLIWIISGQTFTFAIARAISVLVISCPCALGLATPVAIMVGNGMGAKNGILYKSAAAQEETSRINIVALDKTGTITKGEPEVIDIVPAEGVSEHELIEIATSIESKSEHPLAKAIMNYAGNNNISTREITDFITLPGNGLKGKLQGVDIVAGSYKFIKENHSLNENVKKTVDELSEQGKTPMLFVKDGKYIGIIAVADTIKEDSYKGVNELKNMGIKVVMITGDNPKTAKAIASKAGVDHVVAGVLPDGKEKVIIELQKYGKVAMVGDGINDALALTRADIGIAIGAGTDVAIDAADIVLMKSRLSDVSAAIRLSRQTIKNIHENLFWAFFYNVICIPLAAGFYSALFGWQFEMNPMVGAAAMSLSSFTVCMNALRLNLFKDVENKYNNKEDVMTKTVKIEGMMCEHCEARVKKTLEALEGIESATPNHKENVAVIELSKDVDEEVIKKAIEDQDYKYIGIE